MELFVTLGDYISTQKGFAFKSKWFVESGREIVKVSDFTEDSICPDNLVKISDDLGEEYSRYSLSVGDVVIQTVGSRPSNPASVVGKTIRVPKSVDSALLNQNAVKIIPSEELSGGFLYYLLRNEAFKEFIIGTAQGAASQASITLDAIKRFKFLLPQFKAQVDIAEYLENYDDLIENNNRRIAILEDMAQSLYREWFVNFRYSGHQGNLDADGSPKLIDSPLGQIPKGWEVKEFSTSFDFWNGKKCTKSDTGMFDLYGANGIVGKAEDWKYENAVIIGRVGAYCGAVEYCFDKFWGSDNTIVAKCKSEKNISYLFLLLEHFNLNKYAGGSAQPLLTQTTLKQLKYIAPPEDLVEQFELVVHKLFENVVNLKKRNQNLKQQRDMLLPKLISGQIEL